MQNDNYNLEQINVAASAFNATKDQINQKIDAIVSKDFSIHGITSTQLNERHQSILELLKLQSDLSSALFKFCEVLQKIDSTETLETDETKQVVNNHKELNIKLANSIANAKKSYDIFASQLQSEIKLFSTKDKLKLSNDKSQSLLDEEKTRDKRCSFM